MNRARGSAATVVAAFGQRSLVRPDGSDALLPAAARRRGLAAVCGDRVEISVDAGTAILHAVAPRTSEFARASAFRRKVLAANLTRVAILVAPEPVPDELLLARLLVAAQAARLRPLVLLNKTDLTGRLEAVRAMLAPLAAAGLTILEIRARAGARELARHLTGERTLLVGQSGMGKSTLIRALVPGAEVRIGEISRHLGTGRQSTTAARLYELPGGGELVDSPGIAEFGLAGFTRAEIAAGFPEFMAHGGHCRFADCRHLAEPGCALAAAAEAGVIAPRRLALYRRIVIEEACAA